MSVLIAAGLPCRRIARCRKFHAAFAAKRRATGQGEPREAKPLSRGQLHYILSNPVYRGMIRHKSETYPGQHPAIIEEDLWNAVQGTLQVASRRRRGRSARPDPASGAGTTTGKRAWLTGLVRDETGDRLTPTHTLRRGRRFAYYVSNRLLSPGPDPSGWRLPAKALEDAVLNAVTAHLEAAASGHAILALPQAATAEEIAGRLRALVSDLQARAAAVLPELLQGVVVTPGALRIALRLEAVAQRLRAPADASRPLAPPL